MAALDRRGRWPCAAVACAVVLAAAAQVPAGAGSPIASGGSEHGYLLAPPRPRIGPIAFMDIPTNPYTEKFRELQPRSVEDSFAPIEMAARKELAALEQAGQRDSADAATLLDYLLSAMMWRGELLEPEALELAQRAVRIKERVYGPTDPELGSSLVRVGVVFEETGKYPAARQAYERALSLYDGTGQAEGPSKAVDIHQALTTRCRLAAVLLKTGEYGRARRLVDEAVLARPTSHEARLSLGAALTAMGDYETARWLLEGFLALKRSWILYKAGAMANLALVMVATGEEQRARELAEEALAIETRVWVPWHPARTATTYNLALILALLGEHARARRLLQELAIVQERTLGPEHPDLALTLLGMANLLTLAGDEQAARSLYDRVVPLQRRLLNPLDPDLPFTLVSAAWFHWHAGDRRRSVELSLEAERLARRQFEDAVRGLSQREALRYETIRVSGLDLSFTFLASLDRAARGTWVQRVWDELVRSRALVLDEMARRAHLTGDPQNVVATNEELARARGELSKLTYRALGSEDPLRFRDELREKKLATERVERELARAHAGLPQEAQHRELDLLEIGRALPEASALVAFVLYNRLDLPPSDGQVGLQDRYHYLALVLYPARGKLLAVPLGSARAIDERIREWRESAGSDPRTAPDGSLGAEARYRERARRLREAVWDPIARELPGCRTVLVVPDGNLQLVSLATLPADDGGYLVETGPMFHYLSAERDLVGGAHRRESGGLLLVAAPDFDALPAPHVARAGSETAADATHGDLRSAACAATGLPRFSALAGADAEAETLAALWTTHDGGGKNGQNVLMLKHAAADEASFKRLAPGNRIVHLATHGFFLDERCLSLFSEPAAPSRGQNVSGVAGLPSGGDNPLLLSGLALAGANRARDAEVGPGEDGILTTEEVASLDLDGVEWVVLSGCETGLGEPRAREGVLGLRRAFRVAGAASLVMSLWSVQDDGTRLWMEALYRARFAGRSTVDAARAASLERLAAGRAAGRGTHPFFWGAFVTEGDWR